MEKCITLDDARNVGSMSSFLIRELTVTIKQYKTDIFSPSTGKLYPFQKITRDKWRWRGVRPPFIGHKYVTGTSLDTIHTGIYTFNINIISVKLFWVLRIR